MKKKKSSMALISRKLTPLNIVQASVFVLLTIKQTSAKTYMVQTARQGQEEVTDHVNRVEENKTPGDLQTSDGLNEAQKEPVVVGDDYSLKNFLKSMGREKNVDSAANMFRSLTRKSTRKKPWQERLKADNLYSSSEKTEDEDKEDGEEEGEAEKEEDAEEEEKKKDDKKSLKSENFFRSGGFEKIPSTEKEDGEKNDLTLELQNYVKADPIKKRKKKVKKRKIKKKEYNANDKLMK